MRSIQVPTLIRSDTFIILSASSSSTSPVNLSSITSMYLSSRFISRVPMTRGKRRGKDEPVGEGKPTPVWVSHHGDSVSQCEFEDDAAAERVRDVVVPKREVALRETRPRSANRRGKGNPTFQRVSVILWRQHARRERTLERASPLPAEPQRTAASGPRPRPLHACLPA